ncbi:MAG TPA: MAPEG family protein [Micropepsaceae bacterium]|jgi:uncharacterized MAPEG superfamily protein
MITEMWALFASVILGFVHIFAQALSMNAQRGVDYNVGPRDEAMPPLTGVAGRLSRALRNFLETFVLFVAAVVLAQLVNVHNGLILRGAWLYVVGRVVYLPLYAFGIPYIRSLAWGAASAGIGLILAGVFLGTMARA